MSRLLLAISAVILWTFPWTDNVIPFATLSLGILIAVANVFPSRNARHHAGPAIALTVTVAFATLFFAMLLLGNILNGFDIQGVDLTIACLSLTATCFWVCRAYWRSTEEPRREKMILTAG